MVNAKALLKDALKAAKGKTMERNALETSVVAALVAEGKSEKKAKKIVAEKLELPIFTSKGTSIVLVGKNDAEAAPAPVPEKRKAAAEEEPPTKKKKKDKESAPPQSTALSASPAAAASSNGKGAALGGQVLMMGPVEAEAFRQLHRIELTGDQCEAFRPIARFADAGFSPDVLASTKQYQTPTPIQSQCWPIMMAGRDIIGVAETGSGKTMAFFLPALMHLASLPKPSGKTASKPAVLILAPTRELAMQSDVVCQSAGGYCGVASICIYGGVSKMPQKQAIRDGARVVVATPGRLLDLEQNDGAIALDEVSYLVLDEADRMLDMGFEKDVRTIISLTQPTGRRTVMFTATWPDSVRTLASEFLDRPVRVNVGSQELAANVRVSQTVEVLEEHAKSKRLPQLLQKYHTGSNRILIFALYKKEAARLEGDIQRAGFKCIAIHGDMTQDARTRALQQFKDGTVPLLVATDVAARGLDIPDVEAVINYTFPLTIEDYIHRIGRTGRGGKTGISHTLFTGSPQFEKPLAGALQNVLREAGQPVPDALLKFGSSVKKKEHKMYGAFGGGGAPMKAATKIVFD